MHGCTKDVTTSKSKTSLYPLNFGKIYCADVDFGGNKVAFNSRGCILNDRKHLETKPPRKIINKMAKRVHEPILTVDNPQPDTLPTLTLTASTDRVEYYVESGFPNVPGFACDSWCYESPLTYLDARPLDKGRLKLRHRFDDAPNLTLITRISPEPGALEYLATVVTEDGLPLPEAEPPPVLPNLCWQLRKADGFQGKPDPYPEFIARCFIFTKSGVTFLDKTRRLRIPCRADDHEYNNPPWVQMYLPVGEPDRRSPEGAWANFSPDKYTVPVIGTVSRDRRFLTAIATAEPNSLCQAWHDCMHNNPVWHWDGSRNSWIWRMRIYVMENDPDGLLEKVAADFPDSPFDFGV